MHLSAQILALILLTLAALPSESQGIKIHMHDAGGYAADGMLYKPMGPPPFAAIVLIPDRDGITARIEESAQRFAAAGYFTVAIDPNRGMPNNLAQTSDEDKWHDVNPPWLSLTRKRPCRKAPSPSPAGALGATMRCVLPENRE